MSTWTMRKCDRPGCGKEGVDLEVFSAEIYIREPPLANLGKQHWDLCRECAEELRSARVELDLAPVHPAALRPPENKEDPRG